MKRLNKIISLLVAIFCSTVAIESCAMDGAGCIKGNLFIWPDGDAYYPETRNRVLKGTPFFLYRDQTETRLKLKEKIAGNDPLIEVDIADVECDSWRYNYCRAPIDFPDRLAYSMLKHKKEGEVLTIAIGERVVELTCNQKDSRYSNAGNFQEALKLVIKEFKENPASSFAFSEDKGEYLDASILAVLPNGKLIHGPKGFKDDDTQD